MDGPALNLRVGYRSFVVIPARLASTRLPQKLLLSETGKPLIQHTYEGALGATRPIGVCVAADHPDIAAAVHRFGGQVMMTDPHAASGTDRVAEVARKMPDIDVLVNVQGDEPEISGESIDLTVDLLERNPHAEMATLATPIRERTQLEDPSCVKVVRNGRGEALYFSRAADSPRAPVGRRSAGARSPLLSAAHRYLRLPAGLPAPTGRIAGVALGADRKPGAIAGAVGREDDPGVGGGHPFDRHRHVDRLPGVCQPGAQLLRCTARVRFPGFDFSALVCPGMIPWGPVCRPPFGVRMVRHPRFAASSARDLAAVGPG